MTAFAVTGTSRLLITEERMYIRRIVREHLLTKRGKPRAHARLVSGAALGVDSEAVLAVWDLLPFNRVRLWVPGTAHHNYALVERTRMRGGEITVVDNAHTPGATYMARNDAVVADCDHLLAFPSAAKPYRSGTWATINRARRANKQVSIFALEDRHGS
jgi:hypothetical protein